MCELEKSNARQNSPLLDPPFPSLGNEGGSLVDFPLVGPHELWLGETLVAERAERNLRLVVIVHLGLVSLEETKSNRSMNIF